MTTENETISAEELKDLRYALWASRKDSEIFQSKLVIADNVLKQVLDLMEERAVGHTVMYSERLLKLRPAIKAALGIDKIKTK